MLIDPQFTKPHPILEPMLSMLGPSLTMAPQRVQKGVYTFGHWHFDTYLGEGDWKAYPELGGGLSEYGVCDSPEQLLSKLGDVLNVPDREFIVAMVQLLKSEQKKEGWRWQKWGPYIGEYEPQCEYLSNEPVIEQVYTYHVYEKVA